MLDFIVVPHPMITPHQCVACGGANGTVTDTHRELVGYGRVYLCAMCVRRAAAAHGLVKGKRMNELENAAALLDQAQEQLREQNQKLVETEAKLEDANRRIAAVEDDNEFLANRVDTLRSRLTAEAEAALDVLGATADR